MIALALWMRLTYYLLVGVTYSGAWTVPGTAACSWNLPLGSVIDLPEGEQFVCRDRGLLGSSGWLDVWHRPDVAQKYGRYVLATVEDE